MKVRDTDNLRFNALRNALYHTARRRFFEWWNRLFNFAVVILGAAAMSDLFAKFGIDSMWAGLAVAVIAAAQLVFDFGRAARDHQSLQRDYYSLLAEIEENIKPSITDRAAWMGKLTRITADEPPTLRAIDAKAYNDALDAIDDEELYNPDQKLRIPVRHKLFGWFWTYDGYTYEKLAEYQRFRRIRAVFHWLTSKIPALKKSHSAAS